MTRARRIDAIRDFAIPPSDACLLVMLPGARDAASDFVEHGFIEAIRSRGLAVNVIAATVHPDDYLEGDLVDRLARDVIEPARAQARRGLWLMGISLGGMGALLYAREHTSDVAGVVLLAPFLGVQGTIEEVWRAGGLEGWQPGVIAPHDGERRLLAWLKSCRAGSHAAPPITLAYGREDRFARTSEMLAAMLPPADVIATGGGHDWPTWRKLWNTVLDRRLFGAVRAR